VADFIQLINSQRIAGRLQSRRPRIVVGKAWIRPELVDVMLLCSCSTCHESVSPATLIRAQCAQIQDLAQEATALRPDSPARGE
jgi:hypothetical protein